MGENKKLILEINNTTDFNVFLKNVNELNENILKEIMKKTEVFVTPAGVKNKEICKRNVKEQILEILDYNYKEDKCEIMKGFKEEIEKTGVNDFYEHHFHILLVMVKDIFKLLKTPFKIQ